MRISKIASVFLLWIFFGGGEGHAGHHVPILPLFTPQSDMRSDLLFSDIAFRAAYCSVVLEATRPSTSGGHLPDFFAWPGYPKAIIKWKYALWQLGSASKAPPADSVRMQAARGLAEADMSEMTSMERKPSDTFSASTRMDSAACNDALDWLP